MPTWVLEDNYLNQKKIYDPIFKEWSIQKEIEKINLEMPADEDTFFRQPDFDDNF
jgi:hypothetical protein